MCHTICAALLCIPVPYGALRAGKGAISAMFGYRRVATEPITKQPVRTVRNIDLFLSQWELNRVFWSVFLYHCDGI